jgi:hypothetical protein
VPVERRLGDGGTLDQLFDADAADAPAREELVGGVEDPLARLGFGWEHLECGTEQCLQRVEVPVSVYTEVFEQEDGRFIVAPGHQTPENDRLLVQAPTYALVAAPGAK